MTLLSDLMKEGLKKLGIPNRSHVAGAEPELVVLDFSDSIPNWKTGENLPFTPTQTSKILRGWDTRHSNTSSAYSENA